MNEYFDDENPDLDACPKCGEPYDEIDFEYQICSLCGFNSVKGTFKRMDEIEDDFDDFFEDNNPNDSRNL